jgi:hypothetical protein
VLDELQRELPGLAFTPVGLTQTAAEAMGASASQNTLAAQLAEAGLIVGPWNIALADGSVTGAISASPAPKLLVPVRVEGWEWAGVDRWSVEALVRQTVHAVKQIATGEEVKPARPLGVGAIIGIIIGVWFLLALLVIPVLFFFAQF